MNFYKKLSMRTKLLFLSMLTLFLVGAGAWISLEKISSSYADLNEQTFENSAGVTADAIAAQFFERYGDVQAFAVNDSIRSLDPAKMQFALDLYISLYGIYDLIMVVDKNGKFLASNMKDTGGKAINQNALREKNYSTEPWFDSTVHGKTTDDKENNFSGTYFEDFMDDPLLKVALGESRLGNSFSAPIKNDKGEVIAVITNRAGERWLQFDIKNTAKTLSEIDFKNAEVFVLNKDGTIIQHEFASGKSAENKLKLSIAKEYPELFKMVSSGKQGHIDFFEKEEKTDHVAGYSPIKGSKWISSIGWTVLITEEKDESLIHVNQARMQFIVLLSIGCLLALTLAILFSVVLTKALNKVTDSLHVNSGEVSDASIKIASQATQLSESATEQAAALQETMSAVDEISAMVEKNAEAASRSKEVSANSKDAAERGRGIVDQMLNAIGEIDATNTEISHQMENSNRELSEITKLISDIGTKTKVINEIVFQTKLLSFNASVEAARAGEYGKGFSVVAEEVGNLAQMSGNAAKEITSLLEESVRKVEQIVNESKSRVEKMIRVSREKVDLGSKTAKECNAALGEILSNVENVDSLVSEIAVASQEQSTGIKEISKAVGQMEQVTQQNSTAAQGSSVSAEQLKAQAASLNQVVIDLVAQVNGAGTVVQNEQHAQIIPIPKAAKKSAKIAQLPVELPEQHKKAAGSDYVPSSDDPGFGE